MPVGTKGVWQRNPKTEEVSKVYWCATSGCNFKSLDYEDVKEHCVYEHDEKFDEKVDIDEDKVDEDITEDDEEGE